MKTGVSFELRKILSRKKYIALPIINMLICIAAALLTIGGKTYSIGGFTIDMPNLPFTILPLFATVIFPLTIFMLQADMFSAEFESGSIKAILLRPISRIHIFIAKNLTAVIYIFVNLMMVLMLTIFLRLLFKGSLGDLMSALIAYAVTIVPMSVFVIVTSLIAVCINSSSMAMFASIVAYLLLKGAGIASVKIGAALFTSYTGYHKLWISGMMPAKMLFSVTFLLVSYMLVFFILGFLAFDKKEV